MAELKTRPGNQSIARFLGKVADDQQREDSLKLVAIMRQITKAEPKLWGGSIVGFGNYRCRGASGRECDWFQTGFSPRKQNLSIYIMSGCERYKDLLEKLGKHRIGMCCLYIKRLADIHVPTLKKLIRESVRHVRTPLERKLKA
jgi:hypothetical protein